MPKKVAFDGLMREGGHSYTSFRQLRFLSENQEIRRSDPNSELKQKYLRDTSDFAAYQPVSIKGEVLVFHLILKIVKSNLRAFPTNAEEDLECYNDAATPRNKRIACQYRRHRKILLKEYRDAFEHVIIMFTHAIEMGKNWKDIEKKANDIAKNGLSEKEIGNNEQVQACR